MKHDAIQEAQDILIDLKTTLEKLRKIWLPPKLNDKDLLVNWNRKYAICWIHGATELNEANKLGEWLFDNPPFSDLAKKKASKFIKHWRNWLEEEDNYYEPFSEFEVEKSLKDETLYAYFIRLNLLVEKEGKGSRLEWRALKSFIGYLRKINTNESAFLEQIFPKEMDIKFDRIVRKIGPEVPAMPQEVAAKILCQLAEMAVSGRPNSQLTALETLALCWKSLAASRLRLPTTLKMIEKTQPEFIKVGSNLPRLAVPTLFGNREICISHRVSRYLLALSKVPSKCSRETILQSSIRVLRRTFNCALEHCSLDPKHGKITLVTPDLCQLV